MRFLISFITRTRAGGVEQNDKIITADTLTIGRATDRTLKLRDRRVRLEHAEIGRQNGAVHIRAAALAGVTVNGRSQRDAPLEPGDVVEIGANVLTVIEPPDGVDFALTFELSTTASDEHFVADWSAPVAGLGGFSKRRLAWSLFAAVLLIALLLPGLALIEPLAGTLRATPLPDDGWWLAGPVHSAHTSTAGQCDTCHVKAFERVPDTACTECHTVARHVGDTRFAVLGEARCASCHREHNQPPELVNRNQALCGDCHADLPAVADVAPVADFLDAHPEFRITLLEPVTNDAGDLDWMAARRAPGDAPAERSNLKFDHAAHLDPAGIVTPDGRTVIDCAHCHEPEPGGARMQPISMDEHCADCHTLGFDPDDPRRTVPHGDPEAVVRTLVEYYSARLLGADPDAVEQRLRRPGRALSRAERDRAATEARVQALAVAADLFERRACANCHEVTRTDDAGIPWRVLPVRLTPVFFPHARFSHAAHDAGVADCAGCHDAAASTAASDLLLPDIETCRDCHGSGRARRNEPGQLPSTCVMCHSFHFEARGGYP